MWPANSISDHLPQAKKLIEVYMYNYVYCNIIYKSQDL